MTKNEIVARWLGYPLQRSKVWLSGTHDTYTEPIEYQMNYDLLHEAWVKFRDLEFDDDWKTAEEHGFRCIPIGTAILHKSITEAFEELVKGIEWYQTLKK